MARIAHQERDAMLYGRPRMVSLVFRLPERPRSFAAAMQDYSTSTNRLGDGVTSSWSRYDNLVTSNRASVIRQFMILRHDINLPRKKLYNRLRDQDERDRVTRMKGSPCISANDGSTDHQYTFTMRMEFVPALQRPRIFLRDISGVEETLSMEFRVDSTEGFSRIRHTLREVGTLESSPGMPSQLVSVKLEGSSVHSLHVDIVSPWIFSPQGSTMTIADGKATKITSIPMRYANTDSDRETYCNIGALLSVFLRNFDVDEARVTLLFELTLDSYFMNCVLATVMPEVAPVRHLEVVLSFRGFTRSDGPVVETNKRASDQNDLTANSPTADDPSPKRRRISQAAAVIGDGASPSQQTPSPTVLQIGNDVNVLSKHSDAVVFQPPVIKISRAVERSVHPMQTATQSGDQEFRTNTKSGSDVSCIEGKTVEVDPTPSSSSKETQQCSSFVIKGRDSVGSTSMDHASSTTYAIPKFEPSANSEAQHLRSPSSSSSRECSQINIHHTESGIPPKLPTLNEIVDSMPFPGPPIPPRKRQLHDALFGMRSPFVRLFEGASGRRSPSPIETAPPTVIDSVSLAIESSVYEHSNTAGSTLLTGSPVSEPPIFPSIQTKAQGSSSTDADIQTESDQGGGDPSAFVNDIFGHAQCSSVPFALSISTSVRRDGYQSQSSNLSMLLKDEEPDILYPFPFDDPSIPLMYKGFPSSLLAESVDRSHHRYSDSSSSNIAITHQPQDLRRPSGTNPHTISGTPTAGPSGTVSEIFDICPPLIRDAYSGNRVPSSQGFRVETSNGSSGILRVPSPSFLFPFLTVEVAQAPY